MKKIFMLAAFMMVAAFVQAGSKDYYVNDAAVEETLSSAIQVELTTADFSQQLEMMNQASVQADNPNPWVAFALSWVLGGIGVHRVYLGGKGSLILIYFITCGGIFGIVPLIDWIVLLVGAIKGDISEFVNNDAFFMWN
jgi:TM2 domain-containing membrane protein YozV